MKVLHVNSTLDPVAGGGTAERVVSLCNALRPLGIDSSVLTTNVGLTSERIAELLPVSIVALPLLSTRFHLPVPNVAAVRRMVAAADVIHIVGHWAPINAMAFHAAQHLGRPHVVCPAGAIPAFGRSRQLKAVFDWLVGRRLIATATRGVAVTAAEKDAFVAYGLPWDRVAVIPNGITPPVKDIPRSQVAQNQREYILFLGRLSHIKGPDILLEAFLRVADRFQNVDLVFAGPDDGEESGLRRKASVSPYAHRIRFAGFVGGETKLDLLVGAFLLVVPSRREAMSIVALEAGVLGTPVLMTDQCGFDDIQQHGGEIVSTTVEGLSEGLARLMANPVELMHRGQTFMNFVRSEYSWDRAAQSYFELFQQIMENGHAVSDKSR